MMSKSLLGTASPQLIRKFTWHTNGSGTNGCRSTIPPPRMTTTTTTTTRSIEIWTTPCIVTRFGKPSQVQCTWLINPSNPELSGVSKFPYFPRGGPVPSHSVHSSVHKDWQPLGYVSSWGGMEVGTGMMYAVSVVDGLVHQLGGWKLRAACQWKTLCNAGQPPCPIGTAIVTTQGDAKLLEHYTVIVHTTPPFYQYNDTDSQSKLAQCYHSALDIVQKELDKMHGGGEEQSLRIACPLLGAGARGFPIEIAIQVAASSSVKWAMTDTISNNDKPTITTTTSTKDQRDNRMMTTVVHPQLSIVRHQTLAFGLLEQDDAERLADEVEGRACINK